jgi:hypothetical protein
VYGSYHRRVGVCVRDPLHVDRLPPLVLDRDYLRTAAAGHVAHPLPEQPVHRNDGDITGPHGIDERRLHAGRTSGAER